MEKRENVLYEALLKNEEETQKWKQYKDDHQDALTNLKNFRKKMNIEVMVPIGSKAFIPGKLIHTNEILISHFGKMFSNCTSFQAEEICNKRIKVAEEYLKKFEVEKDMFTNKLEMPQTMGAVPDSEQIEIIEEYDEEKEKIWREEHKKKMREAKLQQRDNIEEESKSHEDIMKKLEELELMEELETELEELEIENDETLKKLMSGEIKIQEKPRISHLNKQENTPLINVNKTEDNNDQKYAKLFENIKTVKNSYLEQNDNLTNNNVIPNDVDFNYNRNNDESDNLSETSSDEDIPEEFLKIKKQSETILPLNKKINFLRKKIKSIEKEIDTLKIKSPNDLNVKLEKIEVRDYLLDHVLTIEDEVQFDSKTNNGNENDSNEKIEANNKMKKVKRISFALEDDVTFIDKNETVENMFNKKQNTQLGKDKITLDEELPLESNNLVLNNLEQKKENIKEKVLRNVEFVQENQSFHDCDLISKIINSSFNNTLQIKFKHSTNVLTTSGNNFKSNEFNSPADFYEMFGDKYPQNLNKNLNCEILSIQNNNLTIDQKDYQSESPVKHLSEPIFEAHHVDNELEKPQAKPEQKRPILKNKNAVKQEAHYIDGIKAENKIKKKKKSEENIPRMTLGDVIEKPTPSEEPDKLPECKFVDAHAPKKRISKFKQNRFIVQ